MACYTKAWQLEHHLHEEFHIYKRGGKFHIPGLDFCIVYREPLNQGESFIEVSGSVSAPAMENYLCTYRSDDAIQCTGITNGTANFSKSIYLTTDNRFQSLQLHLVELFKAHVALLPCDA
jgi:hypothetical protein